MTPIGLKTRVFSMEEELPHVTLPTAPYVDGRCLDTGAPCSGTSVECFKLRVKRRLFQNCSVTFTGDT